MQVIDFHCKKLTNSEVSSPYTGNEGNNRFKLTESLGQKFGHFLVQIIHPSEIGLAYLSYALGSIVVYVCLSLILGSLQQLEFFK